MVYQTIFTLIFFFGYFLYFLVFSIFVVEIHWYPAVENVTVSTVQCIAVKYSTVQYSTVTGEEDGVRRWQTPYSALCGASVTGAASLVAECVTNILFKKMPKITFFKPLFRALPKISDWIRKYVQICHDF